MTKMKPSGIEWIGDIPEDWEVGKIKKNFFIVAGATPKTEILEYWNGEIKWITPADYKTEDRYVSYGRKNLTLAGYNSCGVTLVPKNSIVFSKRAPIGSVCITTSELCTNQGCMSCINSGKANSLFFYFSMSGFTEVFELFGSGTTFKEISATTFANFFLPLPPFSTQQKIADYLDKKCGAIDSAMSTENK